MDKEPINFENLDEILNKQISDNDLIQDNTYVFVLKEEYYRVRMPKQIEWAKSKDIYNSRKIELYNRPNTLSERKLKQILKEKEDIDIDELNAEKNELEKQWLTVNLEMAKTKDCETKLIAKYYIKIQEIKNKRMKIILEIAEKLSPALENQAQDRQYEYLVAYCTERHDKETKEWKPVWESYEDYQNSTSNVRYYALGALTRLIANI